MLEAYFDESGIHDGAYFCSIAGFMGNVRQWQKIEQQWEKVSKGDVCHGHLFFNKGKDGRGSFPYNTWSDKKAKQYLTKLLEIIDTDRIKPIFSSFLWRLFLPLNQQGLILLWS